ncbi:hypothetical protein CVN68_03405 [Sphingomonas psychrotolerans]|uniref:Uncharacterized protein n=1 Tax=Sphingomonas psychrotolerans TaxID=1327635 RepID=A0A2K8MDV2_9SPHN|nr:hypothetical protein CVN68_03405 [Sphingomonas psychrotolerans]
MFIINMMEGRIGGEGGTGTIGIILPCSRALISLLSDAADGGGVLLSGGVLVEVPPFTLAIAPLAPLLR